MTWGRNIELEESLGRSFLLRSCRAKKEWMGNVKEVSLASNWYNLHEDKMN